MANVSGNIIGSDCLLSANVQTITTLESVMIGKTACDFISHLAEDSLGYVRYETAKLVVLRSFENYLMTT